MADIKLPVFQYHVKNTTSWVSQEQIAVQYPKVVDMLADVLLDRDYPKRCKDFARSLVEFLQDWEYLTIKQIKCLTTIYNHKQSYKSEKNRQIPVNYKAFKVYNVIGTTDKDIDTNYKQIFGHFPVYEQEMDGYVKSYTDKGERIFLLPTGRERLYEYL